MANIRYFIKSIVTLLPNFIFRKVASAIPGDGYVEALKLQSTDSPHIMKLFKQSYQPPDHADGSLTKPDGSFAKVQLGTYNTFNAFPDKDVLVL